MYWPFAEAGDSYLGRCLCGLDPNDSAFSVLPPHWNVVSPVDDPLINEALCCSMYGTIIAKHPRSIAVMVRLLASVIYASDWLLDIAAKNPGHPFSSLTILHNPELLSHLKGKVTLEPTLSLSKAPGIPPHVKQLNLISSVLELCQTTLVQVNEQPKSTRQSVFDALEERTVENGQISRTQIVGILDEFKDGINDNVNQQMIMLQRRQGAEASLNPEPYGNGIGQVPHQGARLFNYQSRFWDVPHGFAFPVGLKRDTGWKSWMLDMPG